MLHRRWLLLVAAAWLTLGFSAPAADEPAKPAKATTETPAKVEPAKPAKATTKTPAKTAVASNAIEPTLNPDWLKPLKWRGIGPAAMGGRIIALSVFEADPTTYWVATASGGLLKTTNAGTSFEHQFDKEAVVSIGDVCVAPSDRNIVYVGTGENNPRNSVSYGNGVYKSIDGGKTWKHLGLDKTFQIGRIAVHPANPNIVYVGALGRLYGPSPERGLYKTTDGGQHWDKVLFIDDKTGIIDLQMNPADPETLYIAAYERQRDGYDVNEPAKRWGPGSGLYKTADGGKTFKKLTKGLPTGLLGRMGLSVYRKNPNTLYVILESDKTGGGPAKSAPGNAYLGAFGEDAEDAGAKLSRIVEAGPAEKAGLKEGDVVLSIDGKAIKTFEEFAEINRDHKVGVKAESGTRGPSIGKFSFCRASMAGFIREISSFPISPESPAWGFNPKTPMGFSSNLEPFPFALWR